MLSVGSRLIIYFSWHPVILDQSGLTELAFKILDCIFESHLVDLEVIYFEAILFDVIFVGFDDDALLRATSTCLSILSSY